MKKPILILSILLGSICFAQGQTRIAPPRNTYYERTGDSPEAFVLRRKAAVQNSPSRIVGRRAVFPRVLVIMANFSDYAFVSSKADVDSMFNAQHWTKDGATGSIRQYFHDQSNGAYNPHFDVVGPVSLSQGYAYYGAGKGTSSKPGHMVTEACALVNDSVDFTQYDTDNDGKVDMVFVLFAGFGENDPPISGLIPNSSNLVWPHYWTINSAGCGNNPRVFDGKTIDDYECANELDGYYSTTTQKVVAGIGVMVHEFCHGLGLPDLYITGSNQFAHKTWGCWSVMDYGPYNNDMHTPPSMSAYERFFMGWLTPTLLNAAASITLEPISTSNQVGIITIDGQLPTAENDSVYWLIENRQKIGWDIGVPGDGLLLSQIKPWSSNGVNNSASNMKIDLLEADGITAVNGTNSDPIWYGKQGDVYPYQQLDSIVLVSRYPITHIRKVGQNILFDVCGGIPADSTATDIESITTSHRVDGSSTKEVSNDWQSHIEKIFVNGNLYIRRGDELFTISGTKVQ